MARIKFKIAFFNQTLVITAHQLLAQLEEFFPNAKSYIPERWMKGHPLESKHSPYALLPFGFGKRMCIGRRLAELEMEKLTVKVCHRHCVFNF